MPQPLILACDTPTTLALAAADYLTRTIWAAHGRAPSKPVRVAISGGTTPYAMLELLRDAKLPWAQIHWYWVDERFLPASHERSNVGAARRALFDSVQGARIFAPLTPEDGSVEHAAADYEARLKADLGAAPLDLVLLGIGDDGHTASLFPNDPEVHEVQKWVLAVPARAGRDPRISLTRPLLTSADTVILLAQGASKQKAFAAMRASGPLSETPSRLVHDAVNGAVCLVDQAVLG